MDGLLAHTRRSELGMTLVEMMAVVFIIGLATSLVVVTMPERADPAERAADAFTRDVRQVADRAILTGRVQGLDIHDDGYTAVQLRQGDWVEQPRAKARVSNKALDLRVRGLAEVAEGVPELVFDPTGVNDPVEVEMRMGRARYVLTVAADGEVTREAR
ncbi:MAG: GspH/FimT family pseudopilin [Pseudomonadota bacterium]